MDDGRKQPYSRASDRRYTDELICPLDNMNRPVLLELKAVLKILNTSLKGESGIGSEKLVVVADQIVRISYRSGTCSLHLLKDRPIFLGAPAKMHPEQIKFWIGLTAEGTERIRKMPKTSGAKSFGSSEAENNRLAKVSFQDVVSGTYRCRKGCAMAIQERKNMGMCGAAIRLSGP
jgi:hypothetical protein